MLSHDYLPNADQQWCSRRFDLKNDILPADVFEVSMLLDGLGIGGATAQSLRCLDKI